MQKEKIIFLYSRHKAKMLSEQEEQLWQALLEDPEHDHLLKEIIGADWNEMELGNLKSMSEIRANRLLDEIILLPQYRKRRSIYWLSGVAAAVAVIVFSIMLFDPFSSSDIAPGGNRATLTMADGRTIELSAIQNGIIIGSEGISYEDGSEVEQGESVRSGSSLLTLSTPKGGQYQITLPDGTKVWLNAATTLTYPGRFLDGERRVELVGEAYFEVKKNAHQPFKVVSNQQIVEVLGTHFMVSAYPDEPEIKTTLAEGAVEVSTKNSRLRLLPNQQSVLVDGLLKQVNVIADEELAWVNGEFQFNDESLESIMRKLSRWYQIDVVFEDESLKSEAFYGMVSRFDHISKVLDKLEAIGDVAFHVDSKTVTIRSKK